MTSTAEISKEGGAGGFLANCFTLGFPSTTAIIDISRCNKFLRLNDFRYSLRTSPEFSNGISGMEGIGNVSVSTSENNQQCETIMQIKSCYERSTHTDHLFFVVSQFLVSHRRC